MKRSGRRFSCDTLDFLYGMGCQLWSAPMRKHVAKLFHLHWSRPSVGVWMAMLVWFGLVFNNGLLRLFGEKSLELVSNGHTLGRIRGCYMNSIQIPRSWFDRCLVFSVSAFKNFCQVCQFAGAFDSTVTTFISICFQHSVIFNCLFNYRQRNCRCRLC